jgi:hypothetical protein
LSAAAGAAIVRAQSPGTEMKSRLALVLTLFGLSLTLAACDKCGGFQQINYPGQPKTCHDDKTH